MNGADVITIKRVDYAFVELDAAAEEWQALQTALRHAVENYGAWELDCVLPGSSEGRFDRFQAMAERLLLPDPLPVTFHKEDLAQLYWLATVIDMVEVPGLSAAIRDSISDQLTAYPTSEVFPDHMY